MRSEKRSVSSNEIKEVLKSELVTKICGGRVWVVRTLNKDEANLINKKEVEK
jgi:hypothetical protein